MPANKQCVAMLLAGGQGTRLGALTKEVAKPAVPFGGKYKIIDFTLSNTINSDIDTIGVLTQYQPFELNQYIGNGQPWDFDRLEGGAFVLPPYQTAKSGGEWYKGTANAIYQNINFLDRYSPQYVLVLSGDHIYKMDYSKMLDNHIAKGADCTIAVLDVPIEQASRFGIMSADKEGSIYEFAEKPAHPKSTKASMGIYIFTWSKLKEYLEKDEQDKTSSNDFGKNIIPNMLRDGQRMYTYEFSGYWKDVGTISSLWEANMDLLKPESGLNLYDRSWIIYARNVAEPPHYIGTDAILFNSVVSEGGEIDGEIYNSVISTGVVVEKGAKVYDSVIMPNSIIKAGTEIRHSIIGWDAVIEENCKIGEYQKAPIAGEWKIAIVGPKTIIKKGSNVVAGEMIGE